MRSLTLTILTAGLLAAAASPALAGEIGLSGFSGSETVIDFNGLGNGEDVSTQFAADGVAGVSGLFGSTVGSLLAIYPAPGDAIATNFDAIINNEAVEDFLPPQTVVIDFSSAMNRFGGLFVTGSPMTFSLFHQNVDTSYSFLESFEFGPTCVTTTPVTGFRGIENLAGFDRVQITVGGRGNLLLDDMRFEPAVIAVPLPPAAYLGLGLLAGIGVLQRRRRRRTETI